MTIPAGITTVVVSGRYIRPDGTPLTGTIAFEPPARLTFPDADTISAGAATVALDDTGAFAVALIATDVPGMQPKGWTYTVTERMARAPERTYAIVLPAAMSAVDLADIAPADPAQGDYVLVTGPAGKAGSQIYSGAGAPSTSTGTDGDYYVDTTFGAAKIYGPKMGGTWPANGVVLGSGNLITAVNGKTGDVALAASDVGALPITGGTLTGPLTVPEGRVSALGWFNVRTYGAKGDGVTDDTAAIQAALTAAQPAGGGVVYVPTGVYKISAALTIGDNVTLQGTGDLSSIIRQSSTTAHGLVGVDVNNVTITDVGLTGPVTGIGDGVHFSIVSAPCTLYVNMTRVTVKNFGGDGIDIQQPIISSFNRVVAQANGGWGFNFHTSADTGPAGTSCQLTACYGNGNEVGGYRLHKLTYIQLSACAADSQVVGYELDYVYGASLNGCGGEDNFTTVKVNGGGGINITGQFVSASKGTGVHVTGNARPVGIYELQEMGANGAGACVRTDAGTFVTLTNIVGETVNSLAPGTANTVANAAGAATFQGGVTALGTYHYFGGLAEFASHVVTDGGNVQISTAGNGLFVAEGANAKAGVATLVAGTVTVPTTAVRANSRIQLTVQAPGGSGAVGAPYVSTRTASTSFVIKSTSTTDTSVVAWFIVEPA